MNSELTGLIKYNQKSYPFVIEDSELRLFPSDLQGWKEAREIFLENFQEPNDGVNKWMKRSILYGQVGTITIIVIEVNEKFSYDHGIIVFTVNWYITYKKNYINDGIIGFGLLGKSIDYFYPPTQALIISEGTGQNFDFEVRTKSKLVDLGKARINDKDFNMYLKNQATLNFQSEVPIKTKSEISVIFEKVLEFQEIESLRSVFMLLLCYLAYRLNVVCSQTILYSKNKEGKRVPCGEFFALYESERKEENHKDRKKRIIKFEQIGSKVINLVNAISNDEIYFEHMCSSIAETSSYNTARELLIFTAFENEFEELYGNGYKKSSYFHDAKNIVEQSINKDIDSNKGKVKKKLKDLKKYLSLYDNSIEEKILLVMTEFEWILDRIIQHRYSAKIDDVREDICSRMSLFRNRLAHGNMNHDIEAIELTDLFIIQVMIYALRLRSIDLKDDEILKCIESLFGEGYYERSL